MKIEKCMKYHCKDCRNYSSCFKYDQNQEMEWSKEKNIKNKKEKAGNIDG